MKKIAVRIITFKELISVSQISQFRGSVIEAIGQDKDLAHNHKGENYHYRYPLVQYKLIAGNPAIVSIEDGSNQFQAFLAHKNLRITLNNSNTILTLENNTLQHVEIKHCEVFFRYQLSHWLALNKNNFSKYEETQPLTDKIKFLEKILTGNILSMCKGLDITVTAKIEVSITAIKDEKWAFLKKQKLRQFDVQFISNMHIPNYLGLGKAVAHGYGMITALKV